MLETKAKNQTSTVLTQGTETMPQLRLKLPYVEASPLHTHHLQLQEDQHLLHITSPTPPARHSCAAGCGLQGHVPSIRQACCWLLTMSLLGDNLRDTPVYPCSFVQR